MSWTETGSGRMCYWFFFGVILLIAGRDSRRRRSVWRRYGWRRPRHRDWQHQSSNASSNGQLNQATKAWFPFKRNRLRCVNENRIVLASSQSWLHKRQPIGMLGRSSGNHDWLLANASAGVSCGFCLRNASDCVWMETGLNSVCSLQSLELRAMFTTASECLTIES